MCSKLEALLSRAFCDKRMLPMHRFLILFCKSVSCDYALETGLCSAIDSSKSPFPMGVLEPLSAESCLSARGPLVSVALDLACVSIVQQYIVVGTLRTT